MGKKARERREKLMQRTISREREGLVKKACFFDTLVRDGIYLKTRVNPHPVIKIDSLYRQLREEMPDFVIMGTDKWAEKLNVSIRPPFEETIIEYDFAHSEDRIERTAIQISTSDDRLLMTAWVQFAGSTYELPSLHAGIDNAWNFDDVVFVSRDDMPLTYNPYFAALYTLQFLNCRNVELVDRETQSEVSQEYEKYFGQPMTKYKVLRLKPLGKQTDHEGMPKDYQGLIPLHIRRGNFATYTDDAPLFGKFVGTFWRPATVVGEEKRGVVIKDYKVLTE